jgi:Transposase
MFVGWDWASATHDVTVIDDGGTVVDRWAFGHNEAELAATFTRLAGHGTPPSELPVIIERATGLVVDRLLGAGHPVTPVHPTAFHAARLRWGALSLAQPLLLGHASTILGEPQSASSPTPRRCSASPAPSWSKPTTNGRPATAATSAKQP